MTINITTSAKEVTCSHNTFKATQSYNCVLLCFSHLRWDFVYQRPQHLMTRFATQYNVLYVEEPIYIYETNSYLVIQETINNIFVLVPHIDKSISKEMENTVLLNLLENFIEKNNYYIGIKWYITPMMLKWTKHIQSDIIIYDCMDELSAFKNAPPELKEWEQELIRLSDLVFTGGASLYNAKKQYHSEVYLFPSSVDIAHFLKSRINLAVPTDQKYIPEPRIGFYGVIDERLDIDLLRSLALSKPDWNFIIIGPVVKIDKNDLPILSNIYYLGAKTYEELPYYLSGWSLAFIPFAINESTKFISPTKTPEYLAAGRMVVSSPITDIMNTYENSEIVHIADPKDIPAFINTIQLALEYSKNKEKVYYYCDLVLQDMSWDKTFNNMHQLILAKQNKGMDNVK